MYEYLIGNLFFIVIWLLVPIEEILWALTFGALWSSLYEYFKGYTIVAK